MVEKDEKQDREVVIQKELPPAPLLKTYSHNFYVCSDDAGSSLDNSVSVISDDEDDDTSICLPDQEDISCNNDNNEKAEDVPEKMTDSNLVTNSPSGSCFDPKTPLDTPTSPEQPGEEKVVPPVSDKALSSSETVVEVASGICAESTPPPENNASSSGLDMLSSKWKNLRSGGAKESWKSGCNSHVLREEIAKVTSRARTKHEQLFLADVLGGSDSSSSLSDSDWQNENLLPKV